MSAFLRRRLLSLALLFGAAFAPSLSAQCPGPDGLSGPCCTRVAANIPQLPSFSLPGTSICWSSCVPQPQQGTRIQVGTPVMLNCGQYRATIAVSDAAGLTILTGSLFMDYTRTWEEAPTPGQALQVYRFVVKIDMLPEGIGNACNVPACLPQLATAFYYGYLDYAFDCTTGQSTNALVLFHNCDSFIHDPNFSGTPGVFHPAVSYALVYPSTAANPFTAGFLSAPGGAMFGEAMRLEPPAGTAFCYTEDRLSGGQVNVLGNGCACPLQTTPLQVTGRYMTGKGSCTNAAGANSFFVSLNVYPTFPWFNVMTTSIGAWANGSSYPGPEHAWVDEGIFYVRDICSQATGGARKFVEVYYGASTQNGYEVVPNLTNPTVTDKVTDLASNVSSAFPGPVAPILVGTVSPTRNLIYHNL